MTKSKTSGGSLNSKYEGGEVKLVDLMDSNDEYGKKDLKDSLEGNYRVDSINAMRLSQIVDLCGMRSGENGSWFNEYSISELDQQDLISSSLEGMMERVEHKIDDIQETNDDMKERIKAIQMTKNNK